ncbi:MAG: class I SAM-dependent methyltransferase [Syntrophaceae bacterium]|nr:class I SAM-dependent methyltransferase [Syntrophaceae bacterium]
MSDFDILSKEYNFFTQTLGQVVYEETLNFLPHSTQLALDAGCGGGLLSLKLADHVDHVIGLDLSGSMIALAKEHQIQMGKKNIHFLKADLENLPFLRETFDFVVSKATLHHTRLEVTLPGLRQLVRPGGRMVVFDQITSTPHLDKYPIWHMIRSLKKATSILRSHGFRTMWRILSFQLSPQWIRHVCKHKLLTGDSFENIYSRFLPGCRFKRYPWRMIAFWEAPVISK